MTNEAPPNSNKLGIAYPAIIVALYTIIQPFLLAWFTDVGPSYVLSSFVAILWVIGPGLLQLVASAYIVFTRRFGFGAFIFTLGTIWYSLKFLLDPDPLSRFEVFGLIVTVAGTVLLAAFYFLYKQAGSIMDVASIMKDQNTAMMKMLEMSREQLGVVKKHNEIIGDVVDARKD